MKYREIVDGIFLDRPNRFIAHVDVNGTVETVHAPHNNHLRERLMVLAQELERLTMDFLHGGKTLSLMRHSGLLQPAPCQSCVDSKISAALAPPCRM